MRDAAASALPVGSALPAGITWSTVQGADAIAVDTAACTAALLPDGAQLLSWVPTGSRDLLWVSPDSAGGPGRSVRGGVPVVGPWFGAGRHGDAPYKHGWLRQVRWDLARAERTDDEVLLALTSPAARRELQAQLTLRIGADLDIELRITAGAEGLELEAALHTYLAVADVRGIEISGLEGAPYLDNTRGLCADVMPQAPLRVQGPTDAVVESGAPVTLTDPAAGRRIHARPRGAARTVVWNPGEDGAREIGDITPGHWSRFVCSEPAVAKDAAVALGPGASHTLAVTYRIEPLPS
ncbi:D-hexose-6-phosphate mutarotase [Brachybacterium sp. UMB0905]|uniref:D-hexose-6-phosphate mutarotase n=1 Tax=Brachybacterium sp. UMB0905 TaxID=2069310 RepID=UPI000C800CDC|nr:D-hexose-6-phosphate mutarotase [Brachybacterium sp. UMB0905]PMC75779.1 D-hexose-6-phosphate mutarotase [Brachybacterium sp. UMB0905]